MKTPKEPKSECKCGHSRPHHFKANGKCDYYSSCRCVEFSPAPEKKSECKKCENIHSSKGFKKCFCVCHRGIPVVHSPAPEGKEKICENEKCDGFGIEKTPGGHTHSYWKVLKKAREIIEPHLPQEPAGKEKCVFCGGKGYYIVKGVRPEKPCGEKEPQDTGWKKPFWKTNIEMLIKDYESRDRWSWRPFEADLFEIVGEEIAKAESRGKEEERQSLSLFYFNEDGEAKPRKEIEAKAHQAGREEMRKETKRWVEEHGYMDLMAGGIVSIVDLIAFLADHQDKKL